MYTFTNQFGGASLHQRVKMMNNRRSGVSSGWRYLVWALLISAMALACRHSPSGEEEPLKFLSTNGMQPASLDSFNQPWYRQSALLSTKKINSSTHTELLKLSAFNYPLILCLRNNHLALKLPDAFERHVKLFINGQEEPTQQLTTLAFNDVEDLFVYQKINDMPGADRYPESYQILINTAHETILPNAVRTKWKQFLQTNAVSDYVLGVSNTFSMNELLEASFFGNKLAFVKCNDKNYLRLYDDYKDDIDLFIDGVLVKANDIEAVHVRQVDKLYTRERSFGEWVEDPDRPNRKRRYILYIQTSPKRAKRDSSYYVFSPFYTGDF